jgi:hypothetical protein
MHLCCFFFNKAVYSTYVHFYPFLEHFLFPIFSPFLSPCLLPSPVSLPFGLVMHFLFFYPFCHALVSSFIVPFAATLPGLSSCLLLLRCLVFHRAFCCYVAWSFIVFPVSFRITEPEFLNIYRRLKSRFFEKSRLFKGQRVQQGSNWLYFLWVYFINYFVWKDNNKFN